MYKIFKRLLLAAMVLCSSAAMAQGSLKNVVTGTIYSADQLTPLANILVSSRDAMTGAVSGEDGTFSITVRDPYAKLEVTAAGYFTQSIELMGRADVKIYLQTSDGVMSSDKFTNFYGEHYITDKTTSSVALDAKDLSPGYNTIDNALVGRMAGLNVINKSGSVGEGSYYSLRGIRSFCADNAPLIVVDGIPLLVDDTESSVITGFSRNVFDGTSLKEIQSVTLLKGADAMPYGSLGSNGVLSIVTEQGVDQETKIEVTSVNGISYINNQLPVMDAFAYRNYASEVGSTYYTTASEFNSNLPFLVEQSSGIMSYMYNYDTNWQDLIYTPAFTTDNMVKIKGGDAAVKFMFTVGYMNSDGALSGTYQNKLSTRGNANITFNPKLKAYASVSFTYNDSSVQEQGMTSETNPVLAAYEQMPLLDVYQRNVNGTLTTSYSEVEDILGASNPVAVLDGVVTTARSYDMLINTAITYTPNRYFSYDINFGINYSYTKDDIFIGGRTSNAIAALQGGLALNTVRSGAGENKSYYVRGSANFDKTYNDVNNIKANVSYQFMSSAAISTVGMGVNTTSDSYTNLSNVSTSWGREAFGYLDVWNWMSGSASATYTYDSKLYATVAGLADAASSYGIYSDRLYIYPSANVGWRAKNSEFLRDNKVISNLTLRGDYSIIPNSRFDTSYGTYYYELDQLYNISGLVRANLPNEAIEPEEVHSINVGVDLSLARNILNFSLDLYQEDTRNMIVDNEISPVYGYNSMYENDGSIRTRGIELGFSSSIINRPNFQWIVSGTISTYATKILSLGSYDAQYTSYDDGVTIVNAVGASPYEFYGYVWDGVYATTEDALSDGLVTMGGYSFSGGDGKFVDTNDDGIINDDDMTSIGSAIPDFFGGIQTRLRYKKFTLFANFSYSVGNEAYNAVRRSMESGDSFVNQATSMERRWKAEGDVTDIPKVAYGDPADNNRFSSRWIEDASYIKLKEITLSYEHKQKFLFFNSVNVFVTAENLFTITNYTGLDPEFSYSYDSSMLGMDLSKVTLPKTVKLGLVLNF